MGRRSSARGWFLLIFFAVLGLSRGAHAEEPLQRAVDMGESGTLPMIRETVRVFVDHQHAKTTVQRMFRNRTSARLEGRFAYQAGQGATVTGFAYWNGEQKIVGEVFEKEVAQRVYDRTVSRRADPGLLHTDGEGSFTFQVFPIEPAEEKRVELELQQWLPRRRGQIEYTLPIERADASIDIVIEDARGINNVTSPTHNVTTSNAGRNRIRVVAKKSGRDKVDQLVLRWKPDDTPEVAGGRVYPLRAFVHRDPGQDAYVVMSLAATELTDRKAVVAKDVTLVIDHSGSMSGEPLERARDAAVDVVRRLSSTDRLNVILFDDSVDSLFNRPEAVTADTKREAVEFIERMIDGGGTDLAAALQTSFARQHDDKRPKNILFITDGQSDPQMALRAAEKETKDARVFTLGLGEGVDRALLSSLAKTKRGRFTFVESASVLESRVASVYRHIEAPVLVDLSLAADGPTLTQIYPQTLPDLFQADELMIAARVRGTGPLSLELTGRDASGPVRMVATVNVPNKERRPWVGRLWANARIDHIGERIALTGETRELRDETIELALAYNVVTPYTSFLAIPESELTWETAQTLAEARERKARARAKMADAAALDNEELERVGTGGGDRLAMSQPVQPTTTAPDSISLDSDDAPELSSRRDEREEDYAMKPAEDSMKLRRSRSGGAGCASCRAGDSPGPLALLLPMLLLVVRRRR